MDNNLVKRYTELSNELSCAIAVFTSDGKILHLNEQAIELIGRNVINMEVLPGRYVENEDFYEKLERYGTLFTHKAILKAGADTYRIRGMMHILSDGDPKVYLLAFEVRDERIFGSVTLERIIENSGFVAIRWEIPVDEMKSVTARYVSNSISKFGYKREDFYSGKVTFNDFVGEDAGRLKEEALTNLSNGVMEYTREYHIVTKQGNVLPVHDYAHLVIDGMGRLASVEVVVFDISMETRRNADLLLLENAINRSGDIVLVGSVGENGRRDIRYVSRNIEKLGVSYNALINKEKYYLDYISPEDRDGIIKQNTQFDKMGYTFQSVDYRVIGDDGTERWVRDESNLVKLPDGQEYVESILHDITELKNHEKQMIDQQESLEKKLRYIQSNDALSSDLILTDFIPRDKLQNIQSAFSMVSGSYNAIIDLDGEPITYPDGPDENMGAFYDMFEREEYKKGYFRLNKKLREEKKPIRINLSDLIDPDGIKDAEEENAELPKNASLLDLARAMSSGQSLSDKGVMVAVPLFIEDKHMATWISCSFDKKGSDAVERYYPALWDLTQYLVTFVYSSTILKEETEKSRLSELQVRGMLDENRVISDILRRCNETNKSSALQYVLQRVGDYLNVSRIALYHYMPDDEQPTCWYQWNKHGDNVDADWFVGESENYYKEALKIMTEQGKLAFNGNGIPLRFRRALAKNGVRAIVALPVYTLTPERQFIAFDEKDYDRVWTEDELNFMDKVVSIMQGFLQRMRSNMNAQDVYIMRREFLAMSGDYIYVKEKSTGEVLYVNPRLEKVVGTDAVGRKCYEVFRHQSIKCMDCYEKDECRELHNCRMYSYYFKMPMHFQEMDVSWDNRPGCRIVILQPEQ